MTTLGFSIHSVRLGAVPIGGLTAGILGTRVLKVAVDAKSNTARLTNGLEAFLIIGGDRRSCTASAQLRDQVLAQLSVTIYTKYQLATFCATSYISDGFACLSVAGRLIRHLVTA